MDGTTYTANTAFGLGTQIAAGNFVVYVGSGNSVTLSGLTIGSTYYVGDKITAQAEFDKSERLASLLVLGREQKPLEKIHKQQNGG